MGCVFSFFFTNVSVGVFCFALHLLSRQLCIITEKCKESFMQFLHRENKDKTNNAESYRKNLLRFAIGLDLGLFAFYVAPLSFHDVRKVVETSPSHSSGSCEWISLPASKKYYPWRSQIGDV
jgi:hypothetical protein